MLADGGQRLPRSSLGGSDLFLGRGGRPKPGRFEIASGVGPGLALSEHGPCLVGGTMTLDDVSFTTRFAVHSGEDVTEVRGAPRPQTFIRRNVFDRMLLVAVYTSYGLAG